MGREKTAEEAICKREGRKAQVSPNCRVISKAEIRRKTTNVRKGREKPVREKKVVYTRIGRVGGDEQCASPSQVNLRKTAGKGRRLDEASPVRTFSGGETCGEAIHGGRGRITYPGPAPRKSKSRILKKA